jgi:hypothetical protein
MWTPQCFCIIYIRASKIGIPTLGCKKNEVKLWHPSSERKVLYTFDPSFPRCFYRESCLTYEIPDKNTSGMTSNCQLPMKDAHFRLDFPYSEIDWKSSHPAIMAQIAMVNRL